MEVSRARAGLPPSSLLELDTTASGCTRAPSILRLVTVCISKTLHEQGQCRHASLDHSAEHGYPMLPNRARIIPDIPVHWRRLQTHLRHAIVEHT